VFIFIGIDEDHGKISACNSVYCQ